MSEGRESGEVICTHVNWLKKRRDGIDETTRRQHPVYLGSASLWISYMLKDCNTDNEVEAARGERQVMGISNRVYIWAKCHICVDNFVT